jgi:hypothetical protein
MPPADVLTHVMFRHAWVGFIAVTCLNGAVWWWRGQVHIRANPALRSGYQRLIRGWLIYGNLPWLVMGAGILFGGVPSVFHFFNPRNGPVVLAWYVTVVSLWAATGHWLFLRQGAETLVAHPGLLNFPSNRPGMVKLVFLLGLAGGIAGLLMMLVMDIPVPAPIRSGS